MPDELLAPLGDEPLPPLASAATVRARGDQRRQRARVALAGAGAVVVLLGGVTAVTLVDGGEDALRPAPLASSEPTASATASETAEPSTTASPSAPPTPGTGDPSPSAPSTSSTPPAAPRPASELLLTVEDADRAEPGTWTREGQDVEGPLLDPCTGGTDYPRDADVRDSAVTILVSTREAGGTTAVQTVARYSSEAAATDAAAGYERAVRACGTSTRERNGQRVSRTHDLVSGSDVGGLPTRLVRATTTCEGCVTSYDYYAVQRAGDVVSVLLATVGEDGDPGVDLVRPFAREAARNLA